MHNKNKDSMIMTIILLCVLALSSSNYLETSLAQIPETPNFDDKTYFGFEYGTAGITFTLLDLIKTNLLINSKNQILNIVEETLNVVWDNRLEYENEPVASWGKFPNSNTIYPGHKYGAAGIIPSFLNMYNETKETIWLDRAEESYWRLDEEAVNSSMTPNWSYSYINPQENGISITDLKYGAAGVIRTALLLFEHSDNNTYLEHGRKIASWLEDVSIDVEVGGKSYSVLPWYSLDSETLPIKTGYNWGLSGIAPTLYKLGTFLNDIQLQNWAVEMLDFLLAIQETDGSWGIEYQWDYYKTNFDEGISGIIYGLKEMDLLRGTNEYDTAIQGGIDFLYNQLVQNSSVIGFYYDDNKDIIYNSLNDGLLGILKSLNFLDEYLDENQRLVVKQGYEWLVTSGSYIIRDGDKKLMYMSPSFDSDNTVIDFSHSSGLTGLLHEIILLDNTLELDVNITDVISSLTNTLLYFKTKDGYWNKQRLLPELPVEHLTTLSHSFPSIISDSDFTPIYIITSVLLLIPIIHKLKRN